jgi:tetratricopeptide (TPR) repeat protein
MIATALNPLRGTKATLLACALIVAFVAMAHGGAFRAGFVAFDDDHYVYENAFVRQGLTRDSVGWAFQLEHPRSYFHPLTWLSLMLDAELFGTSPWGFHLVNLLLHGTTAVLLFLFLARATRHPIPALLATLLFAVHPLTVEAVAWVAERKAVLSSALGMGALLAWTAWVERPSVARYAAVAALFCASLLAKPGLVVLPGLLLMLDYWPFRRFAEPRAEPAQSRLATLRPLVLEKLPLLALSLAATALSMASSRHLATETAAASTPWLRMGHALAAVWHYARATLLPTGLSVFHMQPDAFPLVPFLLGVAAVVAMTAAALALARRAPWLLVGWGWFLLCLLPYLGFKQVGLWPAWGERFAYLAIVGPAIAGAWSLFPSPVPPLPAARANVSIAFLAIAIPALMFATRAQTRHWHDSIALFSRAAAVEPGSYLMNFGLGKELFLARRYAEAEAPLARALEIHPASAPAHAVSGLTFAALGRPLEAEEQLRAAIRLAPSDANPYWHLAQLLWSTGRFEEARPLYAAFAQLAPSSLARERQAALARARE